MLQKQDSFRLELNVAIASIKTLLRSQQQGNRVITPQPLSFSVGSPIGRLCDRLSLSTIETHILLLCIGNEIEPIWGRLCADACGNPDLTYPTFQLVYQIYGKDGYQALSQSGALRCWDLVDRGVSAVSTAMTAIELDERVLHYVLGVSCFDERLRDLFEPVSCKAVRLPHSQTKIVDGLAVAYRNQRTQTFQLYGASQCLQREIIYTFCAQQKVPLYRLRVSALPSALSSFRQAIRLWQREVKLNNYALLVEWPQDASDGEIEQRLTSLVAEAEGIVFVVSPERKSLSAGAVYTATVEAPTLTEQKVLWAKELQDYKGEASGLVDLLTGQFNLSASAIRQAAVVADFSRTQDTIENQLWNACRIQARPQLDAICERIETKETWEDLILPEEQKRILEMIIAHNRQRTTVYEDWMFASKSSRGLGTSALFSGPSGTGKTMAANVIAQKLNLDLYKVDLSTVVSKYIGETEKNLKRIFDAAETGGVILLFDEADAIFGQRSDVKDARDRYANMEVSYLLQRMESYRGLAILTTNMPDAIDDAFLRRIRFITRFPFPEYEQRYAIWQRVFPQKMPKSKDLDYRKLARLGASGGNIRSIALSAAFLAAAERDENNHPSPVGMKHILAAAQSEFHKLKMSISSASIKGWVD